MLEKKARKLTALVLAGALVGAYGMPTQALAALSAGSEPQVQDGDVEYIYKDGKKTGIKSFKLDSCLYTNLSTDRNINPDEKSTLTVDTATKEKIVSNYILPKWSVVAEGVFRDQADQLVTIEGSGMMSTSTSAKNSFDRQFSFGKAGVDEGYSSSAWSVRDLAAQLATTEGGKIDSKSNKLGDWSARTGLKAIGSLKDARQLMGQSLRDHSDDNDNTVDDFLGNSYDKTKDEYRLPELDNDKTGGGFANVVTCVNHVGSGNDYDYVSFGLAVYDIDVVPIAADGLKYVTAAQDYVNEDNPYKAAAEAKVEKVSYENATTKEEVASTLTNRTTLENTHTAALESSTTEEFSTSTEDSFEWGSEQEVGGELALGKCMDCVARYTQSWNLGFHETWTTTKSKSETKSVTKTKNLSTELTLPPHTQATIKQNTDTTKYSEGYQQPVVINYKVAVYAMSGDFYNGTCGGIKPSRYDKQWLSVLFDDKDGAGAYGCVAQGNLYNRAVSNRDVADYDRVYGSYRSWCDKSAWTKSSDIDWGAIDTAIRNDKRDSHQKAARTPNTPLLDFSTDYQFCESAMTIGGERKAMTSEVGSVLPLYDLNQVSVDGDQGGWSLSSGKTLYLSSIPLKGYNKYTVEFYGFDAGWGEWRLCDEDGKKLDADASGLVTLTGDELKAKENATGTAYVKWVLKDSEKKNIKSVANTEGGAVSNSLETPVVKVDIVNELLNDARVEVTGSYTGKYGAKINLNDKLRANVYDKTDKERRVSVFWECRELDGIDVQPNGSTAFSAPGTYHVRACVNGNNGEVIYSDWVEVTAKGDSELSSIMLDASAVGGTSYTLTHEAPQVQVDLGSCLFGYDQYGEYWDGDFPEVYYYVTRNGGSGGASVSGSMLTIDTAGSYTAYATVNEKMIAALGFEVAGDNWLDEIVLEEPPLSNDELVLSGKGDNIKIDLSKLLSYYGKDGNVWTGAKPKVTFSLSGTTSNATIRSGYFIASAPGSFTITAQSKGYDIEPISLEIREKQQLHIATDDAQLAMLYPNERQSVDLDRLIVAQTQYGSAWKGEIPELKYTLADTSGNAVIENETYYMLDDGGQALQVTTPVFSSSTAGSYTVHVAPKNAAAYTEAIDDITVTVSPLRVFDSVRLDASGIPDDELVLKNGSATADLSKCLELYDQFGEPIDPSERTGSTIGEGVADVYSYDDVLSGISFEVLGGEASDGEEKAFEFSEAEPLRVTFAKAGTYTLAAKYTSDYSFAHGTATTTLTVLEKPRTPIAEDDVSDVADQVYTGSPVTCDVAVKVGDAVLKEGTDFELEFNDNVKLGVASVTVRGIGAYTGTVVKNFSVVRSAAAQRVFDAIGRLSTPASLTDTAAVAAVASARAAYDALATKAEKDTITNLVALTTAEAQVAKLNSEKAYADAATAFAAGKATFVAGGIVVRASGPGTVAVTGAAAGKAVERAKIPGSVTAYGTNYTVTSVAAKAFKGCKRLLAVSLPASVTSIGKDAFADCKMLGTLKLGVNVKSVGTNVFKNCKRLKKLSVASEKLTKASCKNIVGKSKIKTVKLSGGAKHAKSDYKKWFGKKVKLR